MVDLADVSNGDVITSARQNLINDYIQDGEHGITTLRISATDNTTTTGSVAYFARNLDSESTDSPVVSILQDNANDDQLALKVISDGTNYVFNINNSVGNTNYVNLGRGGASTSQETAYFYRNLDSTATSAPMVTIVNDNANDDQVVLAIDNNANGRSFSVSHDSVDNWGVVLNVTSASNDVGGVDIINNGTGNGLFIDQNGNGRALHVDSEATTSETVLIESVTTTGRGFAYVGTGAHTGVGDTQSEFLIYNNNGGSTGTLARIYAGSDMTAFQIDTEATTKPAIEADISANKAYFRLGAYADASSTYYFTRYVDSTVSSGPVMKIYQSNPNDDQPVLNILQSSTGTESLSLSTGSIAINFASAMSSTGSGTMAVNNSPGAGATKWIRCEVNGTAGWIPFHTHA